MYSTDQPVHLAALTAYYQLVIKPAYDTVRGRVEVIGLRAHAES